ncbi:MAG TPA: VWA domain-containing protein [Thermoanaerobaculia bacterium]|nr:VWA domain-containing protein [Thermoanaerobaculia bacterium]
MSPLAACRRRRFALLSLLLLALSALPLPAAQKPPASDRFEETSEVVAVEVPVNVVDRDGQPVRGLTAGDFEVFDEGDRQTLSDFEVIDLSSTEAETRRMDTQRIDSLGAAARRHFLLLFDLSFSSPTSILKARLAARDFLLRALHPSDLAAVATYSLETGPKLVLTFTPDRAQLARAIDTLGMHNAFDARDRDPLRFLIAKDNEDLMASSASSGTSGGAAAEVRAQRDQMLSEQLQALAFAADRSQRAFDVSRITAYSRSLAEMARALNAVQGRKHILLFSEGFDSKLLLGRELDDKDSEPITIGTPNTVVARAFADDGDVLYGNTGLQRNISKMLEEFRRSDSVIQAVDVGGLRGTNDATGQSKVNGEEALFYMANETGGELFKDANDLGGQLARVLTRTSLTYLLTFNRSDLKHDGGYHRLRVKVKAPQGQARVSYRAGYYAPRPYQELDPLEKNLLASDRIVSAEERRDIELGVLAAPFRANETQAYVPVIIEIGGRGLLAGHTGDKLNLELYTYVADKEGKIRDFFTQSVGLDIKKGRDALAHTGIKYYGHLDLTPGDYQVRVLVRNGDTGRTGVESVALSIPTYSKAEPHLLPPLFMEGAPGWLMIRERQGKDQQATVVYPFTVKGEPYVPSARPVLRPEQSVSLCLVGYNLGTGDLKLEGRVVAPDGKTTILNGGHLSLVERTATGISGLDKMLATFQPTGLQAGNYILRVAVRSGNGPQEESSLPFVVH